MKPGASRAPKVRGGQKANFAPTFQKSRVLLHFHVTIFLDSQSQGGRGRAPLDPVDTRPLLDHHVIQRARFQKITP